MVSYIFYGLTALAVLLWVMAYSYIGGLACAFGPGNTGNPCSSKMPWDLNGEDFQFLVLIPGLIVLALLTTAILTGRAAKSAPDA